MICIRISDHLEVKDLNAQIKGNARKFFNQRKSTEAFNLIMLVELDFPHQVLTRYQAMKNQSCPPNLETLFLLTSTLSFPRSGEHVTDATKRLQNRFSVDEIYSTLIRGLIVNSRGEELSALLQKIEGLSNLESPALFSKLSDGYFYSKDFAKCFMILDQWVTTWKFPCNSSVFRNVLINCAKSCQDTRDLRHVFQVLEAMTRHRVFDEASFTYLMMTQTPHLATQQMERLRVHCLDLIRSHTETFQEKDHLWRLIIRKFEHLDRPDIAFQFSEEMAKMECHPRDIRTFNSLLGVYSENQKFDSLVALLQEMKSQKIRPDPVTFHLLVRASYFISDGKGIFDLFNTIKSRKLIPSIDSYLMLIMHMGKKSTKRALMYLQELRHHHGAGSLLNAFTALLSAVGKREGPRSQSYSEATRLYEKAHSLGINPDMQMLITMAELALFHLEISDAEKFLNQALEKANTVTTRLCNLRMAVLYQKQNPRGVLDYFSSLQQNVWLRFDAQTYLLIIRAYFSLPITMSEAVAAAREFFGLMLAQPHIKGRKGEVIMGIEGYLEILCEHSQLEEIARVYKLMEELRIVPSALVYNQLLASFGKFENITMVEKIYSDMLKKKVQPTSKTYEILTNICRIDPLSVIISVPKNENIGADDPREQCYQAIREYLWRP